MHIKECFEPPWSSVGVKFGLPKSGYGGSSAILSCVQFKIKQLKNLQGIFDCVDLAHLPHQEQCSTDRFLPPIAHIV